MEKTIKERRKALRLTQIDMAKACGVSLSAYRMWEYGMPPTEENRRILEGVLRNAEAQQGN